MGLHPRRLALACLVIVAAAVAVAGGSAGNRDGLGSLEAIPGPGAVNYGENIAYRATFTNNNGASGSVFTQVKATLEPPFVEGTSDKATPVTASCGSFDANNVLTCEFGRLRPGESSTLTVVWKAPPGETPEGEPKPGCENCLVAGGTWSIKEGKATNLNETFPVSALAALIGVSDIDAVNGNHRAGGYELEGCDNGDPPSLATNQSIDATANPVTTAFCLPASFKATDAAGGVTATITEPSGGASFARQSEVCIAKPGTECGKTNYEAADFSPEVVVYEFTVADAALGTDKIDDVSHNGEVLQRCEDQPENEPKNVNGCIIDILKPKGNQDPKVWVILAESSTNGPWNW